MTVKVGWAAAAAAVLLIAALFVGWRWSVHRAEQWAAQDAERVMEIQQLREAAFDAKEKSNESLAEANQLQEERDALQAELDKARKRIRNRPKPATLQEAEEQIAFLDRHAAQLERALALSDLTVIALRDSLFEQTTRAEHLERAWQKERERSESFKKRQKRDRLSKIFIGVGSGVGGGLAGYAIGVSR